MPIQIIMTEGLVSKAEAQQIHHDVVDTLLNIHDIAGNSFMVPNMIGEVVFVEKGLTFSGKQVNDIAIVELRVPPFVLSASQDQRQKFVERATKIVQDASGLPVEQIWVNAVNAVEGMWGIAGKAYTSEELGEAISEAAKSQAA